MSKGKKKVSVTPVSPAPAQSAAGDKSAATGTKPGFGALKGSFEILGDVVGPAAEPEDFTFDPGTE